MIKKVAVFCGSHSGKNPNFVTIARELGSSLAKAGLGLVFGGGNVGIMGEVSRSVLQHGGEVIGVIPGMLAKKENASLTLTELHVVDTMRERKALISSLSDAFIMLPGGIGTLDEFFEVYCLAKLGVHHKSCAILNVDGFYDPLIDFIKKAQQDGFVDSISQNMIIIEKTIDKMLEKIMNYQSPVKEMRFWEEAEMV